MLQVHSKAAFQKIYQVPVQNRREERKCEKYDNSLSRLEDAGLVSPVRNVTLPEMPLKACETDDSFKLYTTDIGLTTSMYGFETQKALVEGTLKGHAKRGIHENLIFDILHKRGFVLNYFKKKDNTEEIEFIFERDDAVISVEVMSKRGATESLNDFISQFHPPYAYKLIDGNLGVDNAKITIPQYMAMFI